MFYSRHSRSARVTISADGGWRLRAPDIPVRKARRLYKRIVPGGITGSEGQEGANGVGGGIGARTGMGVEMNEGAQDGNENGSGDGAGTGTGTGVKTRRRTPDGNGDGDGDGSEDSSGDGNGDDDNGNGNKDRIGEGGREAKKYKKPKSSCRRRAGNGGDTGGKGKNVEKKGLVQ